MSELGQPGEPLSPREREVVSAMTEGLSNKLIGAKLSISSHTAKFHVHNVCRKLGVTTRTAAVALAIRGGLA